MPTSASEVDPRVGGTFQRVGALREDKTKIEPRVGLTADARWDAEGLANVLSLRAELEGQWGAQPPPASRYVNLRW